MSPGLRLAAIGLLAIALARGGPGGCRPATQAGDAGAAAARPSLVLIIIDTLRADGLGSYGNPHSPSPELDVYAAQGVRFARVVAQSSWTRPSVASMLTSLHPRSLGIDGPGHRILHDRYQTLPELLRDHGYRTLGITANPHLNSSFNFQQGFDVYVDSEWTWRGTQKKWGIAPKPFPDARVVFREIFDRLAGESPEQRARPHFVQLNLLEVHEWDHPRRWERSPATAKLYPAIPFRDVRLYHQVIRQLTREVAAFVDGLSQLPGFEDAVFAITSDHGEGLADHPGVARARGHGKLLYESQVRVPWILWSRSSRIPEGRVVERPVRLLDLAPTLLDLAGIAAPPSMRGVSLRPLVEGRGEVPLPERFVVETHNGLHNKLGIYGPHWKYFEHRDRHPGTSPRELQAPGRENGRATDRSAEHPELLEEFAAFLAAWEGQHPHAPPTLPGREPTARELEQLRALGYLD